MAGKPALLATARSASAGAHQIAAGCALSTPSAAAAEPNHLLVSAAGTSSAAAQDAGHCLQEYIASLDNLPAEIAYHFAELRTKDEEIQQLRESIYLAEQELYAYIVYHGLSHSSLYEREVISQVRKDFAAAINLADENISVSNRALELVSKHISRLDTDIGKFVDEAVEHQTAVIANKENTFYQYLAENTTRGRLTVDRPIKKARKSRLHKGADQIVVAADGVDWKPMEATVDGEVEDDTPWCYCREPSRGQLIGCDDPECQYAWYHPECVGLKEIPSGSWYCAVCLDRRKQES